MRTAPDWVRLRHAFGTCEELPALLRRLVDDRPAERRAAYQGIDNHVIVQGDLYEAAPFVARELVEIIREQRGDPRVEEAYDLLVELANGSAPATRVVEIDGTPEAVKAATDTAIASGLAQYMADLDQASTKIRRLAAQLLLAAGSRIAIDRAEVEKYALRESDSEVATILRELLASSP